MSLSKLTDMKIVVESVAILVMILVIPVVAESSNNIGEKQVKTNVRLKMIQSQETFPERKNSESLTTKLTAKDTEKGPHDPKENTGKDDQDKKNGVQKMPVQQKHLWLICLSGMFGGLLFGIRDKKLVIPHRKSENIYEPGVIVDVLFGVAGGVVIFLILPGDIKPEKTR